MEENKEKMEKALKNEEKYTFKANNYAIGKIYKLSHVNTFMHYGEEYKQYNAVNANGFIGDTLKNIHISDKYIFDSLEECEQAYKIFQENIMNKFRKKINSLDDLIKFALTNNVHNSNEYMDYYARKIYIEKAKEFGFDI